MKPSTRWRLGAAGLFLLLAAGFSCQRFRGGAKEAIVNAQASSGGGIEVCVRNASDTDFQSVVVVFPGPDRADYGSVARGAESRFHRTRSAYRYAEVRVKASGQDLSITPIDYVGERELSPGRYVYVLSIQDGRLTIALQNAE